MAGVAIRDYSFDDLEAAIGDTGVIEIPGMPGVVAVRALEGVDYQEGENPFYLS